jgi:DNA-binding response OmpR family regulator
MAKLLVAGETTKIRQLARYAEHVGHRVLVATDGGQALEMFGECMPDMVIVGEGLPLISAMEVCESIRLYSSVPLILLVGEMALEGRPIGNHGASLCLSLARDIDVLLSCAEEFLNLKNPHLRCISRATKMPAVPDAMQKNETLYLDARMPMTPKEASLLDYFLKNIDRPLSRNEILLKVWGYDYLGDTRTIDVHVRKLRKKLPQSSEYRIRTIRNVGYIFEIPGKVKNQLK